MHRFFAFALLLLPAGLLHGQDLRSVVSPNGQLEFQIFTGTPEGALYSRIGYRILLHGKPLLDPSWVGFDILNQEPLLGEKAGLTDSETKSNPKEHYNSLVAHYLQNGSLGREIVIEAHAYDDGIAFRYVIPRSTPLQQFLARDEVTEFNFAQPGILNRLPDQPDFDIPLALETPGVGWVVIAGAGASGKYPATYLVRSDNGMTTNLARSKNDPEVAYSGATPLTWPWRVILAGPDRERLLQSDTLKSLNR